ncbi:MBL fold metallo-hydrolase [Desulforamulus hydrothermalis]|uniref:beta-lactamase n=1 Tax=Desulforamulus hydrothermalis Lam5 = DSM 18033 TaxID=1121428 RepID=K8EIM5_9FIRM|nr:MBL fold metallo-hydrolase [Desulforamulus hydrothermalis]CCO08456.1 Beta-lactamase domain protein [Desulforamulus hydrothermalis Lam5 = DSM 18033]SHH28842.1 Glyoxylase, beta-lactamase superfamily II [Desulforamulus hydrothermalis Lam5 = DSM 18033]
MALEKIKESVHIYKAPTNVGVITNDDREAVLIDTGIDESIARKLLREVEAAGFHVKYIINTHSHADHIGGNPFISGRTGALICASALETPFIENTILEPAMLNGGAFPWKELRNKFLQAKPSSVAKQLSAGPVHLCGLPLEIVSLPGHSLDQIGVLYDGVLFCGDAYISSSLLDKHGIPYNVDIQSYLASLEKLESFACDWYVPSHGAPSRDIASDLACNRSKVIELLEQIDGRLTVPWEAEELVAQLCSQLGINAANPGLFFLYRTAVMAYLSYLYEQGRAKTFIQDNRLLWHKQ